MRAGELSVVLDCAVTPVLRFEEAQPGRTFTTHGADFKRFRRCVTAPRKPPRLPRRVLVDTPRCRRRPLAPAAAPATASRETMSDAADSSGDGVPAVGRMCKYWINSGVCRQQDCQKEHGTPQQIATWRRVLHSLACTPWPRGLADRGKTSSSTVREGEGREGKGRGGRQIERQLQRRCPAARR